MKTNSNAWSLAKSEKMAARKGKYSVHINIGVEDGAVNMPGWKTIKDDGGCYSVAYGTNFMERCDWQADAKHPFVITGTVGEQWVTSSISGYDIDPANVGVEPVEAFTKDPSSQPFLSAVCIPANVQFNVAVSSSFDANGKLDAAKMLRANDPDSAVPHAEGDYLVFKDVEGKPSYLELSEAERNSLAVAKEYSPRIVNGTVMARTYDVASTREEIEAKYR